MVASWAAVYLCLDLYTVHYTLYIRQGRFYTTKMCIKFAPFYTKECKLGFIYGALALMFLNKLVPNSTIRRCSSSTNFPQPKCALNLHLFALKKCKLGFKYGALALIFLTNWFQITPLRGADPAPIVLFLMLNLQNICTKMQIIDANKVP